MVAMKKITILMVISVIIICVFTTHLTASQGGPWESYCLGINYTANSQYHSNLKLMADYIPRKVAFSPTLFASESVGYHQEDTVFMLAQCRRDTNISICRRCISQAFKDAKMLCAFRKGAFIFRDICTIGYYKKQLILFPNNLPVSKSAIKIDNTEVAIHSNIFNDAMDHLTRAMVQTTVESPGHYITGQKIFGGSDFNLTIYSLAECIASMSAEACHKCLQNLVNVLFLYEMTAGRAANIWCNYRVALHHFFVGDPMMSFPAINGTVNPPTKHHKNHKILWVVLVVICIALAVAVVTIALYCYSRKRKETNPSLSAKYKEAQLADRTHEASHANTTAGDDSRQAICLSALESFHEIQELAQGKQIAIFLDYDGTLSPIVSNPEMAYMTDEMRNVVRKVANIFPTSIVSGRARQKVFEFVKLPELNYAGSHGMDIMLSVTQSAATSDEITEHNPFQPASEFRPVMDRVFSYLEGATKDIDGAKVESNTFCISVHYRNVHEQYWRVIEDIVNEIVKEHNLKLTTGKMVFEVRPPINWDKGNAVEYLLGELRLHSEGVLPIYIGDDWTDEDAFKVLRRRNNGLGILVSQERRETAAFYTLKDPCQVMEFLDLLVELGGKTQG